MAQQHQQQQDAITINTEGNTVTDSSTEPIACGSDGLIQSFPQHHRSNGNRVFISPIYIVVVVNLNTSKNAPTNSSRL